MQAVIRHFILSSFNPAKVLKGKFSNSLAAVSLRKALVVFQFIISIVLIIASVIIANQMNYLRSADLGFDKDQQIIIPLRSENAKNMYTSFKNELLKQSAVRNVGASLYYPGISNLSDNMFFKDGENMQQGKDVKMNYIDTRFLQTLNIKPVAGGLYSDDYYAQDTTGSIVINETAVKFLDLPMQRRRLIKNFIHTFNDTTYNFTMIGVVKDFHYEDLHLPIGPFGFQLNTPPAI